MSKVKSRHSFYQVIHFSTKILISGFFLTSLDRTLVWKIRREKPIFLGKNEKAAKRNVKEGEKKWRKEMRQQRQLSLEKNKIKNENWSLYLWKLLYISVSYFLYLFMSPLNDSWNYSRHSFSDDVSSLTLTSLISIWRDPHDSHVTH